MKHLGLDESHCTMTDICRIYLLPKASIVRKKKHWVSFFFFIQNTKKNWTEKEVHVISTPRWYLRIFQLQGKNSSTLKFSKSSSIYIYLNETIREKNSFLFLQIKVFGPIKNSFECKSKGEITIIKTAEVSVFSRFVAPELYHDRDV